MTKRTRLLTVGCLALMAPLTLGLLPASAVGALFSDGFETGNMSSWTTVRGVVVDNTDAYSGTFAARATSTGTAVYARKKLASPAASVDYTLQFKLASASTTQTNLIAMRPTTGAPVAQVFLNAYGRLAVKAGGFTTVSRTVVAVNVWHGLKLHVEVAGSSSTTQVWLDGAATPVLTSTTPLTTAMTIIEVGDPVTKHKFNVRFDDVVVQDTSYVDSLPPTTPTNLAAAAAFDRRVDLSWDAATDDTQVTGYAVFRDGAKIASVGAVTNFADLSAVADQTYSYQVQARDAAGNTSALSDPATAITPPATSDRPVTIAAAGDIACPPTLSVTATTCQQTATSDLLLAGQYDRVLTLGDNQYSNGSLNDYLASYDPSWGRAKAITSPVPGNHEYQTTGAAGYYAYFGGAAGDPQKGYYSYDVGDWHLIALNSNCANLGPTDGCAVGTPQHQWLQADLAAHPTTCTLAYWHHPLASSDTNKGVAAVKPFWDALYTAGADVVLNGHSHAYERFVPMNPDTVADPTNGIREFVVGTGGKDHGLDFTPPPTSEVRNTDTFGILELTLNASSYDWNFIPTSGGTFTDTGTASCH